MPTTKINIPDPEDVSEETSDFGKREVAALTDGEFIKYTFQDEILHFKKENERLNAALEDRFLEVDKFRSESSRLSGALTIAKSEVEQLRRGKVELVIALALVTLSMTIGGTLISSYPNIDGKAPWQFYFGWALIVMSALLGVFQSSYSMVNNLCQARNFY